MHKCITLCYHHNLLVGFIPVISITTFHEDWYLTKQYLTDAAASNAMILFHCCDQTCVVTLIKTSLSLPTDQSILYCPVSCLQNFQNDCNMYKAIRCLCVTDKCDHHMCYHACISCQHKPAGYVSETVFQGTCLEPRQLISDTLYHGSSTLIPPFYMITINKPTNNLSCYLHRPDISTILNCRVVL